MKTIQLTCDICGAQMDLHDDVAVCSFCGTTKVIDDETVTNNYNYNYSFEEHDEARIRENETREKIRLQELENQEKEKERVHKENKWLYIFVAGVLALCILFTIIGSLFSGPGSDEVQMPCSSSDLEGENYVEVVQQLKDMGFTRIKITPIHDLVTGWITDDGDVEKVSIGGDTDFEEGEIFEKDEPVTVTYHTF